MPAYIPTATGVIAIPLKDAAARLRYQLYPLSRQTRPDLWPSAPFLAQGNDWYGCDINALNLDDGAYEYLIELQRGDDAPILLPDPTSQEIDRYSGYRSLFHILHGKRVQESFDWSGELGKTLPENNQLVIYELPVRWVDAGNEPIRQVGLGTFDKATFEHLDSLTDLGINAIELLPIQDSPDTLNWGYGTRFFFAPDLDMGAPCDLRCFIKACHQKGVRVILDVVMNHSRDCALEQLAHDWFYLTDAEEPDRAAWGGQRFRYASKPNPNCTAHEFLSWMAEFWVDTYHVDGFRIDEFKGINNWAFIRQFTQRAWSAHPQARPFIVIAEDSGRDRRIVQGDDKVLDAMWNFDFHDEIRNLIRNQLGTNLGEPGRRERTKSLLSGGALQRPNDGKEFRKGFGDLSQAVNYFTSHDVQSSPRLMSWLLNDLLSGQSIVTNLMGDTRALYEEDPVKLNDLLAQATDIAFSAWALTVTSVGIPMVLAGEEFLDVHDIDPSDWRLKMSDPVNWERSNHKFRADFRARIQQLIQLRTSCPALQRNEIEFLYFGDAFDSDAGERSFVYCRTGGQPLGQAGQVAVFANLRGDGRVVKLASWPWANAPTEEGGLGRRAAFGSQGVEVELKAFETRVFLMR
jgi:1,4-alpha-glucan branching enzyme